jgi:hypothetical protein
MWDVFEMNITCGYYKNKRSFIENQLEYVIIQ